MRIRIALFGEHGNAIKAKAYVDGNKAATIYATAQTWAAIRAKLEAAGGGDVFVIDDLRGAIAPAPPVIF